MGEKIHYIVNPEKTVVCRVTEAEYRQVMAANPRWTRTTRSKFKRFMAGKWPRSSERAEAIGARLAREVLGAP